MQMDINNLSSDVQKLVNDTSGLVAKALHDAYPNGVLDVSKASLDLNANQYGVSLEQPAKQLMPFLPFWQSRIPREVIPTGNQKDYKRITRISAVGKSTAAPGVKSAAAGAYATDAKSATFGIVSSGLWDIIYEAERAAGTFDDLRGRLVTNALLYGRLMESAHIFGGNVTALGQVTNVVVADSGVVSDNGVGFANVPYYVYVKAITHMAMMKAVQAGAILQPSGSTGKCYSCGVSIDQTDGYGAESTVATATPTATHSLKISFTPIPAAAGYAIYIGTTTGYANAHFVGITGQSTVTIQDVVTTGDVCATGDTSADSNDFNGMRALMCASGSGSYVQRVGAALTPAYGNGILEINKMLSRCYLNGLGTDQGQLVCGVLDRAAIGYALGQGAANSVVRYPMAVGPENTFAGGAFANKYVHPVTGRLIDIVTDPYMVQGTIAWVPDIIPFPQANVDAPVKLWLSYDWTNFEYSTGQPSRQFENRMRGGLAMYMPPIHGMLYDVWQP
jgi:hypothetical protein